MLWKACKVHAENWNAISNTTHIFPCKTFILCSKGQDWFTFHGTGLSCKFQKLLKPIFKETGIFLLYDGWVKWPCDTQ